MGAKGLDRNSTGLDPLCSGTKDCAQSPEWAFRVKSGALLPAHCLHGELHLSPFAASSLTSYSPTSPLPQVEHTGN